MLSLLYRNSDVFLCFEDVVRTDNRFLYTSDLVPSVFFTIAIDTVNTIGQVHSKDLLIVNTNLSISVPGMNMNNK